MFQVDGKPMATWNVHVGCDFLCTYCNARRAALTRLRNSPRYKDGFSPHLVKQELGRKFKPGSFVFVGYMGDISFASRPIIIDLTCRIAERPEVDFLFCTKSPLHYWYWHIVWPENLYLGATIETNRDYHLTRAPAPLYRYIAMRALDHPKKFLSIEPVCDFDLDEMLSWIAKIDPQIIEVGADNYHNGLPEPPWEKVDKLLTSLKANFPTVVEKVGLGRLKHDPTGT
ncbi:hypothetical protein LCGC14_1741740 [marine sediment metagenome]|uniref:Radical SAM core domain-containing protein n=1 Tax=marine sediment metagenome TaxID=412755 RepID=A0A0F9JLN7_9ZZZZ